MGFESLKKRLKDSKKFAYSAEVLSDYDKEPKDYIPMPTALFNLYMTASLDKGMPSNTKMVLYGGSGEGKSLVAASIAKSAIEKCGYKLVLFETEGQDIKKYYKNLGIDFDEVLIQEGDSTPQLLAFIKMVVEDVQENPESKYIMVIDSIGMLSSQREIDNIGNTEMKSNMGSSAIEIGQILKSHSLKLSQLNIPTIVVTHKYADPNAGANKYVDSDKHVGGEKLKYFCDYMFKPVISERTSISKDNMFELKLKIKKARYTSKNPDNSISAIVNWKTGFNYYEGLVDLESCDWETVGIQQGRIAKVSELPKKDRELLEHNNFEHENELYTFKPLKKGSKYAVKHLCKNFESMEELLTKEVFTDEILQKLSEIEGPKYALGSSN